ncbi:tetratricopeptide repeat protein [Micromonospora sp. NBC_01813]|uniref:tetratricopeptide repeat protein n=1 Tax=Micromonospora sp. NBC_01813 TaxID=2975988 RepID=UPI002DD85A51|nr:tetratricopeptide repeat protein [Micromonospora sp. NBC_01813]WSA08779.1 tetratricopeptide repeat protein [Micromonospora sp. NBC_01813]
MADWRRWFGWWSGRSDAAALVRDGERWEKRGRLAEAEDAYRRADAAGSAEGASCLGVLLFERGEIAEARAALIRADERGSATGAFRLGFLLEEVGQVDEAEDAYRRAVDRGSASAANNLTTMLRQRGDTAGADAVAARLAEATGKVSMDAVLAEAVGRGIPTVRVTDPDDLSIALAAQEHAKGRTDRALQSLREVMAAGRPAHGLAALNLGILLEERGDLAGARHAYGIALASGDTSSAGAAGLNLGLLAVEARNFVEAERLFRAAAESDHPLARIEGAINLAGALLLRGAVGEARIYYRRVVDSGHPEYAPQAAARLTSLPS